MPVSPKFLETYIISYEFPIYYSYYRRALFAESHRELCWSSPQLVLKLTASCAESYHKLWWKLLPNRLEPTTPGMLESTAICVRTHRNIPISPQIVPKITITFELTTAKCNEGYCCKIQRKMAAAPVYPSKENMNIYFLQIYNFDSP